MDRERRVADLTRAICMLDFATWAIRYQMSNGRGFVLEHPARARSWSWASVTKLLAEDAQVKTVTFDQCEVGLVSKSGVPLKKRTRFLTNMNEVICAFENKQCSGLHDHMVVQGTEQGERVSTHAQRYPVKMCQLLAKCIRQFVDNKCVILKSAD